jgi:hypothetical protein
VPTRHERIGVIKDEELSAALDSVSGFMAKGTSAAALVHDLAIRGAQALRDEEERRRAGIERLVGWSTGESEPPWDPRILANIDQLTRE